MKTLYAFAAWMALSIASPTLATSQIIVDPNKPFEELTKDEADVRIRELQEVVKGLENRLNTLKGREAEATKEIADLRQKLKECDEELYRLVEASKADVDAFRQQLGVLEGKVREMKRLSNNDLYARRAEVEKLQQDYFELRKKKISLLPEFYDRMVKLGKDIQSLFVQPDTKTYTVRRWSESGDCLWTISGREEIYSDVNQWPKIWQANTDQIRNPDLIFPGQVLVIPTPSAKTPDEIKAERKYYRQKRARIEAQKAATIETGDAK